MIAYLASGEREGGHVPPTAAHDPVANRPCTRRLWDAEDFNALIADQPASVQRDLWFLFAVHRELAGIAHDLKTPVTVIGLLTQLLQDHIASSERADCARIQEGLARISTTAGKMSVLLDDLLALVRRQPGERMRLRYQSADLVTLVGRVVAEHQLLTNRHQIRIDATSLPRAELPGRWDVPHLERALGNVVSNAIKYSPDGGEIVVEMGRERKARGVAAVATHVAVLSFRDRGVGIPAADLAAIFEPFHRATNVVRCLPGLGIGLTTAQRIIAQHGGSIRVASELGQGTSVTIHLPLFPADRDCDSGTPSALGQVC